MGKDTPAPPPPPDPKQTSAAQTGTNVATAIANTSMGMIDQYTPYGSLTYSLAGGGDVSNIPTIETITDTNQSAAIPEGYNPALAEYGVTPDMWAGSTPGAGSTATGPVTTTRYKVGDEMFDDLGAARDFRRGLLKDASGSFTKFTDPYTGKTYRIPRYKSEVKLTPEQQGILDSRLATQQNLADLASDRSDFLLGYLPQTEAITDQIDEKIYDMGARRLDPRFDREREALRTRLINQGVRPGSEAYDREMSRFGETQNDAYNQLVMNARGTALNEVNLPINQIIGLLSGTQVQNPNVSMAQPAQIPTTDNAGIIMDNYSAQMQNYNAQMKQRAQDQSIMGGLFGAGATLLGAPQGSILGGWLS